MSESTRPSRSRRYRRARRGQTLIVALAVLFILLFIGGLFVARVARNLVTAARSVDTQDAQALAQAGLDYCNDRLNFSPEGADWRPIPSTPANNADPDYYWLERGFYRLSLKGGRALVRVAYDPNPSNPDGQALRIEAVGRPGELPTPAGSDPTVFVPNGTSPRLRRELIAYKQTGITDYLFYITGKTRTTTGNFIGTPAIGHNVATVLGNPMLGFPQYQLGVANDANGNPQMLMGAPIYCNGDLTLGQDTYIYESALNQTQRALQQQHLQVNGNINLAPTRQTPAYNTINDGQFPAYLNQQINQPPVPRINDVNGNPIGGAILPSSAGPFDSFQGQVRDSSTGTDISGVERSVPRLSPPLIDTTANGTGVMRYRMLTRDSGYWYNLNGKQVNTGQFGFGRGIYVNNSADLQRETTTPGLNGAYSLRSDWLNPGGSNWGGPFYHAPGLLIELLGDHIRLTRDNLDNNSFYNTDLTPELQNNGKTLDISLADIDRQSVALPGGGHLAIFPHNGDEPAVPITANGPSNPLNPFGDKQSYGVNVVLFAEGNVRIKGVYGAVTNPTQTVEQGGVHKLGRVHLTVVSGGTAYIEGNLVRGDGYVKGNQVIYERASTCAIMAKDYVCVNTTMFMQPQNQQTNPNTLPGDLPNFAYELGQTPGQTFDETFSWGVNPLTYTTNGSASPLFLMVRHGVLGAGEALINLLINPTIYPAVPANAPTYLDPMYEFPFGYVSSLQSIIVSQGGINLANDTVYDVTQYTKQNTNTSNSSGQNFDSLGFLLQGNTPLNIYQSQIPVTQTFTGIIAPGYDNTLRFQLDQTATQLYFGNGTPPGSDSDYMLSTAFVAPMDIRIEAAMYAQEKSFFIIPGYSLNPDPTDDRASYITRSPHVRVSYSMNDQNDATSNPDPSNDVIREARDVFPFYGEPSDIRITICGSIAQNYTASQGDQAAWMARWGYIPQYYGSTQYYANGNAKVQIPDDHLFVHDPSALPGEVPLTGGQDRTIDYRTPLESQRPVFNLPLNDQDFPLTQGLRYVYNPTFAFPYYNPTDYNTLNGDATANALQRKKNAIRTIVTKITVPGGATYHIVQVLPPIPNMPVCPNYIYAGETDRLIGSAPSDTDNFEDLGGTGLP